MLFWIIVVESAEQILISLQLSFKYLHVLISLSEATACS